MIASNVFDCNTRGLLIDQKDIILCRLNSQRSIRSVKCFDAYGEYLS